MLRSIARITGIYTPKSHASIIPRILAASSLTRPSRAKGIRSLANATNFSIVATSFNFDSANNSSFNVSP